MKIAVWHNLSTGGGKRALHTHVRGLVERGHEVRAWTVNERHDYLPISDLAPEKVVPLGWSVRTGGSAAGRVYGVYHNRVARLRAMTRACIQCAEEMDAGGFDVVLVHGCEMFGMPFIMRHLRTTAVLYLHEPYRPFYEARPVLPWLGELNAAGGVLRRTASSAAGFGRFWADRAQAREEQRNAAAAGTILVNSLYSRESVIRAYGRDARVCYLGVDTELFRPAGLPRERFVVGLGAVDPAKGVDLAIDALARLPAPRPPLVWVGDRATAGYGEQMAERARAAGVEFSTRVRLTDAQLVELLNRAGMMLYTSHLEPFGLAPLEAAACGTPVVAVAEGGVRETIRTGVNGFAVGQRDAGEVAAAVARLLDDPALARRLGDAGAEDVRAHWSLSASADRMEAELLRAVRGAER